MRQFILGFVLGALLVGSGVWADPLVQPLFGGIPQHSVAPDGTLVPLYGGIPTHKIDSNGLVQPLFGGIPTHRVDEDGTIQPLFGGIPSGRIERIPDQQHEQHEQSYMDKLYEWTKQK